MSSQLKLNVLIEGDGGDRVPRDSVELIGSARLEPVQFGLTATPVFWGGDAQVLFLQIHTHQPSFERLFDRVGGGWAWR